MARERIGIMGGSFNPIHERHLALAACALAHCELDRVLFIPTGNPPHKREGLAPAEHRYEMTRLAVLRAPRCEASRIELEREGVIYTLDTLRQLRRQRPQAELFFIVGEDTLADLPNWHEPDKVFALCTFLVSPRSTEHPEALPVCEELARRGAKLLFLPLSPQNVSATAIREKLRLGEPTPELPTQVTEYIRIMGLYGAPPSPPGAAALYPRLRQRLSDRRLLHSLLVAATARDLAHRHHIDEDAAAMAGLLHDCAKCMSLPALQKVVREQRLLVDKQTLASENLLHSAVGSALAESEYGVTDENVLSAIRCHTAGKVGMLPLDMALWLADKVEPSRKPFPALAEIRRLSQISLIDAMDYAIHQNVQYVEQSGGSVYPPTYQVADWLDRLTQSKPQKERVE